MREGSTLPPAAAQPRRVWVESCASVAYHQPESGRGSHGDRSPDARGLWCIRSREGVMGGGTTGHVTFLWGTYP